MSFKNLKIADPIVKALVERGFKKPTKIQEQIIPLVIKRKDIVAITANGTGKTGSFSIPIANLIHKIDGNSEEKPVLRVIIISSNQDLAKQTFSSFGKITKHTKVKHTLYLNNANKSKGLKAIEDGINVLVTTPPDALNLLESKKLDPKEVKILVIDGLDEIFAENVTISKSIFDQLPSSKQTIVFTSKLTDQVDAFCLAQLTDPERLEVFAKAERSRNSDRPKRKDNRKDGKNVKNNKNNRKKKGGHNKRRSTEMSDKLKSKFLWPLE